MRLRQNRLKQYNHRAASPQKDREGASYTGYGPPHPFLALAWPAGGKVQAAQYGMKLPYIYNLTLDGAYTVRAGEDGRTGYVFSDGMEIRENDGICLFVPAEAPPDYRIIAVRPYPHLYMEAERI